MFKGEYLVSYHYKSNNNGTGNCYSKYSQVIGEKSMFKNFELEDIFIGVFLILIFTMICIPIYALIKEEHRKNICWEKPYSEYIEDERCKKLLED